MEFKGQIASKWHAYVMMDVGLLGITALHYKGTIIQMLILAFTIMMALYLIPVYFRNKVVVDKKNIVIYFGFLKRTIPTKEVVALKEQSYGRSAFNAGTRGVGIVSKTIETTYVSVKDLAEFIKEIQRLNHSVKHFIL